MKTHTLFLIPVALLLIGASCQKQAANSPSTKNTALNQNSSQAGSGQGNGQGNGQGSGRGRGNGSASALISWQNNGNGSWVPSKTPPSCPTPLFGISPTDVSKATSILYPGQERGGNYKPHGGFRFDTIHNNTVTVTLPIDAQVIRGARYLVNGEVQYTFDFITDCGYMIRFGHLRELSAQLQQVADTFPAAQENDSRTNFIDPPVRLTAGTVLATKVGTTADGNTFFDFGVYNLLTRNTASQNAAWAADPVHDPELAQHAVCWFDLLPASDAARVKTLPPGDPTSGKTSAYCT